MRSMGQNPTEDEVLNLVIEYDVNGDGTIDFDEFMEMMKKQAEHQDNSAELKEAFKIFDRDGNGYIDAAELKKVCFLPFYHSLDMVARYQYTVYSTKKVNDNPHVTSLLEVNVIYLKISSHIILNILVNFIEYPEKRTLRCDAQR